MGRLAAKLTEKCIVVTKYSSDGFIIPYSITHEKKILDVISENIDSTKQVSLDGKIKAVARGSFIYTMLSGKGEEYFDKYNTYCKGLFSERDMSLGITWAEASYLLYFVLGYSKNLKWDDIVPIDGYKVCVIHDVSDKGLSAVYLLSDYKNSLDMEVYVGNIIEGTRYIPLPLYCSFVDLMSGADKFGITLSIDDMFRKVTDEEFYKLFGISGEENVSG